MSEHKTDLILLPDYSPSLPPPSFTCEPTDDETRLQLTPRTSRSTPTGTFIKRARQVTVSLYEQEDDIEIPVYGRHGLINGSVFVEDPEMIVDITIQVDAKLETMTSEAGTNVMVFYKHEQTLWRRTGQEPRCPDHLPFSYDLPSTYGPGERPLPPSYHALFRGFPALYLKIEYAIHILVTKVRCRKINFLTKTTWLVQRVITPAIESQTEVPLKIFSISVPFKYHPRTRAHRPIVPTPCFFSSVKCEPEEWYQVFSEVKTRPLSQLAPIYCNLFIPGARVYGLLDKIPFHIQLNGPITSLRAFLGKSGKPDQSHSSTTRRRKSSDSDVGQYTMPRIRVYLLRQVAVEIRALKAWRNQIVGEGKLWELPPGPFSPPEGDGNLNVDWEGEVQCSEDVSTGGFTAGNAIVKDFIVLSIEPLPGESPFLALQMSIPIRLVTDPWEDVTDYDHPAARS